MRVVFLGTAEFGVPTLELLDRHHDLCAVVTLEDTCKGRGQISCPTPVKSAAMRLKIPVIEAGDLRDGQLIRHLRDLEADCYFVVAFRILPPEIFTIPPKGTVNLHASLLPDYRGAAPINWAVVNGETRTGVTTFYITEKVDTGDIILTREVDIGPEETAGELHDRLMDIGAQCALDTIDRIEEGTAPRIEQPMRGGKPAPRLSKNNGRVDWDKDAQTIHNLVRGMNPWPGAFTESSRGPLKIHRTRIVQPNAPDRATPGTVVEASDCDGVTVQCGSGYLRLLEVQPPGKRPISSAEFCRGYPVTEGRPIGEIG